MKKTDAGNFADVTWRCIVNSESNVWRRDGARRHCQLAAKGRNWLWLQSFWLTDAWPARNSILVGFCSKRLKAHLSSVAVRLCCRRSVVGGTLTISAEWVSSALRSDGRYGSWLLSRPIADKLQRPHAVSPYDPKTSPLFVLMWFLQCWVVVFRAQYRANLQHNSYWFTRLTYVLLLHYLGE